MNPLLNIQWDTVRMIAIDGAQVEVLTMDGPQKVTFTSEAEMEPALHEWFQGRDSPTLQRIAFRNK